MEALISFLGKKKEKTRGGKKEKKNRAFAHPCVELSPFMLYIAFQYSIPTH